MSVTACHGTLSRFRMPILDVRETQLLKENSELKDKLAEQSANLAVVQQELADLKLNLEAKINAATEAAKAVGAEKVAEAYKDGMEAAKIFFRDLKAMF